MFLPNSSFFQKSAIKEELCEGSSEDKFMVQESDFPMSMCYYGLFFKDIVQLVFMHPTHSREFFVSYEVGKVNPTKSEIIPCLHQFGS